MKRKPALPIWRDPARWNKPASEYTPQEAREMLAYTVAVAEHRRQQRRIRQSQYT